MVAKAVSKTQARYENKNMGFVHYYTNLKFIPRSKEGREVHESISKATT